MNNSVANGLPLGLRIYDQLEKQNRFRYNCAKGVVHQEFQYSHDGFTPPWQIKRLTAISSQIDVYMLCDEGTEYFISNTCPDLAANITIKTIGAYDYIIYPATHTPCTFGLTDKTLLYLRIEDGVNTWYSEQFWLDPSIIDADTSYRVWIPGGKRSVDANDLRIWR